MYSKFFFFLLNIILLSSQLIGQQDKRVNEKPEDKVGFELKLEQNNCSVFIVANIKIIEDWHINAANLPIESYSVPTQINLDTSSLYTTNDSIFEPEFEHIYDSLAKEDLYLHDGNITIKKRVTLLKNISDTIKGEFVFQTCDDKHCLPIFAKRFEFVFKPCDSEAKEVITVDENSKETLDSSNNKYLMMIIGGALILALLLWILKRKK